ncbi:MAG: acetyl-CoA hydrolase, partial [Betaproteobacteria bacterium]|nr:acetyl-CoA hydrolase [Betaproteobacteria bacterium]
RAAFSGATLFMGVNWSGTVKAEHADHLRLAAYCGSGHNRKLADAGVLDIHPHPYSQLATLIRQKRIKADVVLVQVSPPNVRGEYSLGLSAEYLVPALEVCRAVIAEVNDRVPWTYSDRLLKRSDFAAMIETSREPVALPYGAPGPQELAIARNALAFIPDGATIETGLGALPDAVLRLLGERKDLRIHSGSIGDGVVALSQKGVVREIQGGTLMGTRQLFDFAHENAALRLRSIEYTHNARVLGGIERFVAINSAIEIDFTGQVNAEVAKGSYLGAVGGALDFVRAASQSPGGVSLMLLPAVRIVETLQGPVATPRSEAGVIVTERGAADLRGRTLREREKLLRELSGSS